MAINMAALALGLLAVCIAVSTAIGSESTNRDVTYEEVLTIINDPNVLLVDVREPEEIAETGIIPSAINIPLADFQEALGNMSNETFLEKYQIDKPNLDSQIVIYCRSGSRALVALNIALELGYKNTRRYAGSWLEWSEEQKKNAASPARLNQTLLLIVSLVLAGRPAWNNPK